MILNNEDTRKNVVAGAEIIYDAVRTTLGPKGRNVLIKDKFGQFTITHDGVTVAKAVQLKNEPESIGIEILKEASKKMDEVGDGTTTVTVLTYHLLIEANKLIDGGANPMMIKRELEACIEPLIKQIKAGSKEVGKNLEDVAAVAAIAVGDQKLGDMIADLMVRVGFEGAITVETSQGLETEVKVVEGYTFDKGYLSPYMVTDQNSRSAILKNPAIIIIDGSITALEDFKNVIDPLFEKNVKEILIIADNVEANELSTLILNKVKNVLTTVAVKGPSYDQNRKEQLKDIAILTGGRVIDTEVGNWVDEIDISYVGAAEKIVVTDDETVIIGGLGETTMIAERVARLKKQMKKAGDTKQVQLQERVAALTGSVGIIKVGGATESETEEKKYRIDDAVAAVKAALEGGIVAGGGVTLRDISYKLEAEQLHMADVMVDLLRNALRAPHKILLENSGYERTASDFEDGYGLDVVNGDTVKMLDAGIIDPTIVTCEVVRNAITTANLAITVGGSIVEDRLTQEEMTALMGRVG